MNSPIVELKHIQKLYPGVRALKDLSLDFRPGEVHAIAGENGAGKSTMIKIISGATRPSNGSIVIEDKEYTHMTPKLSQSLGISVIYQEFTLVPVLSVAENIFLGNYPHKLTVVDSKKIINKTKEIFEDLNINIDPNEKVGNLTTGFQQIVEIAKALSKDTKVLIMDEPSAALSMEEVESMFNIIERLKSKGVSIIYITHRLEEIFKISDRISVLRDGEHIITIDTDKTNEATLIKHMVGRELTETYPSRNSIIGETILSVNNLTGNGVENISFDLRKGEILGFAGLIGAGRTELMELIIGYKKAVSGNVFLNDEEVKFDSERDSIKKGLALAPEDRKKHGLLLELNVSDNISLPIIKSLSKHGVIDRKKRKDLSKKYITDLNIKTPSEEQLVRNLSGGNQQKIVVAKWLATDPEIIIFDEPTRGIDVGAKYEIYKIMNELVSQGKSIIMISSDMEEVLGMADRIIVLSSGKKTAEIMANEANQEMILEYSSK